MIGREIAVYVAMARERPRLPLEGKLSLSKNPSFR